MRLPEIFRYEVQHRIRSASTWVFAVALLLIAFLIVHVDADGPSPVYVNAPAHVAQFGAIVGMLGMLATAAFFSDAVVRDYEAGMDPLLFTAPIRKVDYLAGRFLGALAVNAAVILAVPLGSAIASQMPYLSRIAFGPFNFWGYAQSYLLFILPNVVMSAAILFTIAVLTRQAIPVYLGAAAIFVGYVVAVNIPAGNPVVTVLTDPFGVRALNDITSRWTPFEKNTRMVASSMPIIFNRLGWLAISGVVLALVHRRFRFAHHAVASGREAAAPSSGVEIQRRTVVIPATDGVFDWRTSLRQTATIARRGLAEIVASPGFRLLFLGKAALTVLMGWDAGEGVFDTSTTPLTILIYERLNDTPLVAISVLLIAIFAGELVWKNRDAGMAEIADASPVSESAEVGGRFLALVGVLALLQVPVVLGGVFAQAAQHYFHFEPLLYLKLFFGMQLADLVLLAALAMLVHVVVNSKYVGHFAVLIAFLARPIIQALGWVQHHLLVYATDPGWKYSGMNGFGPFLEPVVWFKLYWMVWALVLLIVAALLWVRGREIGIRTRLAIANARFGSPLARAIVAAGVLILLLGGFVFYNTNVLNDYLPPTESDAIAAKYEQRYRRYLGRPQPTLTGASLEVEVYPERALAELSGTYTLINQTNAPIDSVHVFIIPQVDVRSVSFDREALPTVDDETGYRIYALGRPLAPGDSLRLTFAQALERRGFTNDRATTELAANGTWIDRRFLPLIGYQPAFEPLGDIRDKFKLGPPAPTPYAANPGDALNHQQIRNDADLVHAVVVIGTSDDQVAFTAGQARRNWTENGRRYFEYELSPPTSVAGGYFSARYAVTEDRWRHAKLQVLHDPGDGANVDRMMNGMKSALEYYSTHWGEYPDSEMTIVEVPRYTIFGRALPTAMAFSEDAFHSDVKEGQIDQPFYGVAHEVAHHWWGGMANPAPVRGSGLLSESLANYSAIMVMEKTYGPEVARRVYKFQMDRYFSGRAEYSREVPVVDVNGQPYISYRKGAVALYTMRDLIGENAMNVALGRYAAKFRRKGSPYPTSLDLVAELRAATPDSLKSMVADLFETVTLWEVREDSATSRRLPDGRYEVTMAIQARKLRADSVGRETEVPMNDLVEIGVFSEGKDGELGEPLLLERRRITNGKQIIRAIVAKEPKRAGIDPYDKTIDRERGDNMREVKPLAGPESVSGPRG